MYFKQISKLIILKRASVIPIFAFFALLGLNAKSQVNNHVSIYSFALSFEDGNPQAVATSLDSSVYINYIVNLNDTSAVKKVYVRISNGQNTNGDVYKANYDINSPTIKDNEGNVIFSRSLDELKIRTIKSTQQANLNFEVATESTAGVMSNYLIWQK